MQLVAEATSHSDASTKWATLIHRDGMALALELLAMVLVMSGLEMLLLGLTGYVRRPVDKALGKLSHLILNRGDDVLHGLAPLLWSNLHAGQEQRRELIFSGEKPRNAR